MKALLVLVVVDMMEVLWMVVLVEVEASAVVNLIATPAAMEVRIWEISGMTMTTLIILPKGLDGILWSVVL